MFGIKLRRKKSDDLRLEIQDIFSDSVPADILRQISEYADEAAKAEVRRVEPRVVTNFATYLMSLAEAVARKSKDPSSKVGCVIVGEDNEVLSTGFNGLPMGVKDLGVRMERPDKYTWTSHAEENAVALAARSGHRLKGSSAFVTHQPCARCARILIQAGVKRVVYGPGKTSMPDVEFLVSRTMLDEAGVICEEMH